MKISSFVCAASAVGASVVAFLSRNGGPLDGGEVPARMAIGGGILPLPGEHMMSIAGGLLLVLFLALFLFSGARAISRN
jgi:hypothetical protein